MSVSQEREEAAAHSKTLRHSESAAAHSCGDMRKDKDMDSSKRPRRPSPVPSCVSLKSNNSILLPPYLSSEPIHADPQSSKMSRSPSPVPSCVSLESNDSIHLPPDLSNQQPIHDPQCISSSFEIGEGPNQGQSVYGDGEPVNTSGHSDDKHTDNDVLRRVIEKHKASLKKRIENISEGIIKSESQTLSEIYTELFITEGESGGVNKEHEVWQVESASRVQTIEDTPINCNDIFKPLLGQDKYIRTVMTKGIAGIGKTISVQKFILDWIDGVANQNVDFMFPLSFREINLVRNNDYSLHSLLLVFHPELKELKNDEYKDCHVVFIFDGLDESRSSLNFGQTKNLSDVKQASSVDDLMTNLIQGNLCPSALIWITSRPAAVGQIPAQYIDQVTEVRGFNDSQKEEYFRKRISDENQANKIISHIKASRCLHIMCHVPVFCWIAATVLQEMLKGKNIEDTPKTLTEMFIHFLLILTTRKDQKYQGLPATDKNKLLQSQKALLLKLAQFAFNNQESGNLIFYQEDLNKFGIDVSEASVYSGVCTVILKEESVLKEKVYCFVHLSIQEFLAAVFVFHCYVTKNHDLLKSILSEEHKKDQDKSFLSSLQSTLGLKTEIHVLLKSAVDDALRSRNGQLDLFLRFLMGISLEKNQRPLQGLLDKIHNTTKSIKETCWYIKNLNRGDLCPERCINLLHCLSELNDHSMHEEIQEFLSSKNFKQKLSPAHCSALAHMLLMSEEGLDEFDLKKYNTSDEGRSRLLPAVRYCRKARLADCRLTDKSSGIVARVLQSPNSLIELDLSTNDLGDSGVELLSKGLFSPLCRLQRIRLSFCKLTHNSWEIIAVLLQSSNSLIELDLSTNDLGDSGVLLLSKGLSSPSCKLQKLRLSNCGISDEGYVCLALTLVLNPTCVKELDVSNNHPGESAQKLLSATLEDPDRKVKTLLLFNCTLTDKSWEIVATVLQSSTSLRELDLGHSDLEASGLQLLSKGMSSPHCKLQKLRLVGCRVTDKSCDIVAAVLQSPNSLIELDLSHNELGDSGIQFLSMGLSSPHCKLQTLRFDDSKLTDYSCGIVATVLQSSNSFIELDLSHNDLGDSGVQLLSEGLSSPQCKLQTLRLSDCLISEKGCVCLALFLTSNTSHLKELDLSYNHPGESGLKQLSARLEDPVCKLEILRTHHASLSGARPRLLRYACKLTLDPNTAGRNLSFSEGNRKVTWQYKERPYPDHPERFDVLYMIEKQPYTESPERFDSYCQVLCREGLSGRCYWEVEWSGRGAEIAVAYKSIERKGRGDDVIMGYNAKSWSLFCSPHKYSASHNNKHTHIPVPSSGSRRVGVYLDWPAGTLSFYSVSSDTLTHLHRFHFTFTEPLYPGFVVGYRASVSLCQIT